MKSKSYKKPFQCSIFIINNISHVLKNLKQSQLSRSSNFELESKLDIMIGKQKTFILDSFKSVMDVNLQLKSGLSTDKIKDKLKVNL